MTNSNTFVSLIIYPSTYKRLELDSELASLRVRCVFLLRQPKINLLFAILQKDVCYPWFCKKNMYLITFRYFQKFTKIIALIRRILINGVSLQVKTLHKSIPYREMGMRQNAVSVRRQARGCVGIESSLGWRPLYLASL